MSTLERATTDSIVQIAEAAVSCEVDGETTVLNTRSGEYYGLDEVGASVWRKMRQPQSVTEIIQEIRSEYEVDLERCQDDLLSLINELAARGLIEISTDGRNSSHS
jgi:Coenzyme PQQ synthesis protein D (PqqD)